MSCYDKMVNDSDYIKQVDFLAFYCSDVSWATKCPFWLSSVRDNSNYEPTDYDKVFRDIREDGNEMYLIYVSDYKTPVKILRWKKIRDKWLVSVYGKSLRLYYNWEIQWLRDYVKYYYWDMQRVDLAFDNRERISEACIDLKESIRLGSESEWTYKWFWNKNSELFIRIYDKTKDLRDEKNSHSYLYPDWYLSQCWRTEIKLTWSYCKVKSAVDWLDSIAVNKFFTPKKNKKRDFYKSGFYNFIMSIEYVLPNKLDQFRLYEDLRAMINKKYIKLLDVIKVDKNEE